VRDVWEGLAKWAKRSDVLTIKMLCAERHFASLFVFVKKNLNRPFARGVPVLPAF
jgi:hypothetical protein